MSRADSVSAMKVRLSGILVSLHAELKHIKIRGRISPLKNTYFLSDGEIGIGCLVTPFIRGRFAPLLVPGTPVIVQGSMTLCTDPGFNEYEINVSSIEPDIDGGVAFSMSQVEEQLLKIIKDQPELMDVQVKGKINRVGGLPGNVLSLKDPDGSAILCEFHNNNLPNQDREEVFVRGKICNFSTRNRIQYRIDVAETELFPPDDSIAQCQCSGCKSCQTQGNMCPSLQDPEYKLCANCYHESADREDRVVQAVYAYFDALGGNGFSPQKEWPIQIGADNRRADVVLIRVIRDGTETFAAIAECKGAGYKGNGIAQLNGYLSATGTCFGIFANQVDPGQWTFYKRRELGQYDEIGCDEFKKEVKRLTDPHLPDLLNQIEALRSDNERLQQIQQRVQGQLGETQTFLSTAMERVEQAREEINE